MEGLALSDAVELLRQQIADAHDKSEGAAVRFPILTLTVTFNMVLTKEGGAKASFKVPFWGAGVEAGGKVSQQTGQTVTLVLGPPVDPQGNALQVVKSSQGEPK